MLDVKNLPCLTDSQEIFEGWIKTLVTEDQLSIQRVNVENYFCAKRFPKETSNAIYLAKASLLIEIEKTANALQMTEV